jgi:starch phosphorylase
MKKKEYFVTVRLPDGLKKLEDIAYNLWWTYNRDAQELFKMINPNKWEESHHSPTEVLMNLSVNDINTLSNDEIFMDRLDEVWNQLQEYKKRTRWFSINYNDKNGYKDMLVAYFSAEYGIHESLHLYAGGLGILSGDHCKAACYLGLPFIAVGLLYRNGYFHQYLNTDGWQQEYHPFNEFYKMPFKPVKDKDGKDLIVFVEGPDAYIFVKVWETHIGNNKLVMLDTDIEENRPEDRVITGQLYGGDSNMRIRQEIILGIGGMRALKAMNMKPTVYHINEGHPAFVLLERLKTLQKEKEVPLDVAIEIVKKSTLFTTHTPVPAGFDVFGYDQMNYFLSPVLKGSSLKINDIMKLGRFNENNPSESFSMAVFAIKLSNYRNGVSKLHGQVSRSMFKSLWPKAIEKFVPIGHVVNGVHLSTWVSDELKSLYNRYVGEKWILQLHDPTIWKYINNIPDVELYNAMLRLKTQLIAFIRRKLWNQAKARGASSAELIRLREVLNPNYLTIGFARRFASYKRAYLLFMNEERLAKIINNEKMPVQVVIAGKAHPRDDAGKNILKRIIHTIRKPEFKNKIVFIEDYDMDVAKNMVTAVDIWLNTPRRPMEACGTSGMKVAANGGLNFSVLDGWWDQAYNGQNGWSIGSGEEYDDENYQDMVESEEIYDKLENEIIPLFYLRDKTGVPREWLSIVKNSMRSVLSYFNTTRMVIEYAKKYYLNLHSSSTDMECNNYSKAYEFVKWQQDIANRWGSVKFVKTEEITNEFSIGNNISYNVVLEHGGIDPLSIAVYVIVEYNPVKPYETARFYELNFVKEDNGKAYYKYDMKLENAGRLEVFYAAFPKHKYIPNLFETNQMIVST